MHIRTMVKIRGHHESDVESPAWQEVEAAVHSLDGDQFDGICLESDGDSYMGICGGNDRRYVVAGHLEGFGSFICASGKASGPARDVAVAGDHNTYASANVLGVEAAVIAAQAFYEHGVLSEQLVWKPGSE